MQKKTVWHYAGRFFRHIEGMEDKEKRIQKNDSELTLPKTALPIAGAVEHWIDIDGSVYAMDSREGRQKRLIKKTQSEYNGYKYCGIRYENGKIISKRVHRLVAEAFIPNPNGYRVIGHKNNIKSDNRVENLYWTTTQENTQKAYDDGLAKNDIGSEDSQAKPVVMYDTYTNAELGRYGSCKEAVRETGLSLTTICRQAKYHRPTRKPYYFRYEDDAAACESVIGMFDFDSDRLLKTFINCSQAAKETGISERSICQQVENGRKPKRKRREMYFLRLKSAD